MFVAHETIAKCLNFHDRRASSPHIISCHFKPYNPLNGTPGEIRTHTILVLSQTPHANWATGAYARYCELAPSGDSFNFSSLRRERSVAVT